MSASPSYSAMHSQTPSSSGYRLRPVRLDSVPQHHSVSPSPPPPSGYGADVATPSAARVPPMQTMHTLHQETQALPSLSLSPTSPNGLPRPWSPPAGVREIDAAPPLRRAGLPPPPTGHELMSFFPAPSPNWPPKYAAPSNSASGSGSPTPNAPVPVTIPTSGWFISEERKFFAREGKEIQRLKREEILGIGPSGSGSSGSGSGASSTGMKRERESDGEGEAIGAKRSPPVSHSGPLSSIPTAVASSSPFHTSPPPTGASSQPSHSRSHSASQPQPPQPFLTLVQSQPPYRQPPPPPPRDREPVRDRERGRVMDGEDRMHSVSTPLMSGHTYVAPPSAPQHGPVQSSPPPMHMHQGQGHVNSRGSSYGTSQPLPGGVPAPQQQHQQYTYTHSSPPPPPPPHPHSQPAPAHMRGSYTHPPPPPPPVVASRGTPSYSVQPPSHLDPIPPPSGPPTQAQPVNPVHPAYSAVPPPAQHPPPHPPPHQQSYSVSPPSHARPAYMPDPYARERERVRGESRQERGREAYPSPSPSRNAHPNADPSFSEGFTGNAYFPVSERRRAGKHTRRVFAAKA